MNYGKLIPDCKLGVLNSKVKFLLIKIDEITPNVYETVVTTEPKFKKINVK